MNIAFSLEAENIQPVPPGVHIRSSIIPICFVVLATFTAVELVGAGADSNTVLAYTHRAWKKEHGLPDNSVRAITQTSDGYLWIATRAGLGRFDGVTFTVFNRSNSPELIGNEWHALVPDDDGGLWIGTDRGVLYRSGHGSYQSFPVDRDCSQIRLLASSHRCRLWIVTECGLYQLVGDRSDRREIIVGDFRKRINALYEDPAGLLWIGTEHGLWRFDPASGKPAELLPDPRPRVQSHVPFIVTSIGNTADGTVWADFLEYKLMSDFIDFRYWVYGFKDGQWTTCAHNPFSNAGRPFFIRRDRNDTLWLPDSKSGLIAYHNGKISRLPFVLDEVSDYATCFFQDREGSFWVGTENSGLHRFCPKHVLTISTGDGLAHNSTWTICEARDGSVWIGTDGGVSRVKEGRITNFTQREGLPANTIRSIVEDRSGTIWAGTGNGLSYFKTNTWTRYSLPGELSGNKIRVLYRSSTGGLWVGREGGLTHIEGGPSGKLKTIDGLAHNDVRALLEDRSGALWIGTYGGGLHRMTADHLEHFGTTNGLVSDFVWALHEDNEGSLWIGTDRGLHRCKKGRFAVFTRHEGLFDDAINQILEDDLGRLWISCDRGIYRVEKRQLELAAVSGRPVPCVVYDEEDGLLSTEANGQKSQPAGCRTRDGRLWFAMAKGIVALDSKHLPDNTNRPSLIIEQVRANGEALFNNGLRNSRATASGTAIDLRDSSITLPPGSAHLLEIQYTAPSFVASDAIQFKYRLVGLDKDWIQAGTRRMAYYANLLPGPYHFQVIAINKYGVSNVTGASFSFTLAPFFWQTWWFRALCLATPIVLIFGLHRWRVLQHRRIAAATERAEIARDLHDHLGPRLTLVQHMARSLEGASSSDDNGEPVQQKLARLAAELNSSLDSAVWAVQPDKDTLLSLVDYLGDTFHELLASTDLELSLEFPEVVPVWPLSRSERYHLALVAVEALNNILKHSHATLVRLNIELNEDAFKLRIMDNGSGFNPQHFTNNSHEPRPRTGNGLANMRHRIESLGGKFELLSQAGQGTTIAITLKPSTLRSNKVHR